MPYLTKVYRCALRMQKGCGAEMVARSACEVQKRRDCTITEHIKQKAGL
jgi:hypothetical protein